VGQVILPAASTFYSGFWFVAENLGAGAVTIMALP
jgi:hypothetical protein